MEPEDVGHVFVDHKETQIQVPRPRQLSSSGVDITPKEDVEDIQSELTTQLHVMEESSQSETSEESHVTTSTSHVSQQSSTTTTVKKHVTTIYTQRISGRSSGSSTSETTSPGIHSGAGDVMGDDDAFSEQKVRHVGPMSGFVFGPNSRLDGEIGSGDGADVNANQPTSPSQASSIAVTVSGGIFSATTTAYSRIFSKTVDTDSTTSTTYNTDTKERHLSECSFSVSGAVPKVEAGDDDAFSPPPSQESREENLPVGIQQTEGSVQQAADWASSVSAESQVLQSQESKQDNLPAAFQQAEGSLQQAADWASSASTESQVVQSQESKQDNLPAAFQQAEGSVQQAADWASAGVSEDQVLQSQERKEDSVSGVFQQATGTVQQAAHWAASASTESQVLQSQELNEGANIPTQVYSQDTRGEMLQRDANGNEYSLFQQEMKDDSLQGTGPNAAQLSQETRMSVMSEEGATLTQNVSQESREDGISAWSLESEGQTQESDSAYPAGLSVSQQNLLSNNKIAGIDVDSLTTSTTETGEKGASEYSPGLAIRSLTLEDLQEKRTSPELDEARVQDGTAVSGDSSQGRWTDMSTSRLTMTQSTVTTVMTSSETSTSRTASGQLLMQCTDDTRAARPSKPIEIERKFTITDDTEAKLESSRAQLQKEKVFTDAYFDDDNYSLILTDCWLRRRNDSWEVKVPVESDSQGNAQDRPSTQYRELTEEKEISAWLVDKLNLDSWLKGDPVDLLVQAAGLTEFARFTTTRRSYTLDGCTVDLDLTSHGFRVGEIEVMAASPEEIPQALKTISGVADRLGLERGSKTLGKMSLYLLKFKPQLYRKLVNAKAVT